MYGMYLLRKEEMLLENGGVKEFILYHVTTEQKGLQSLENGLDWRRTIRSRFGVGVSFSDDADYADYHASHSIFGGNTALQRIRFILMKPNIVLIGYT